MTDYVICNHQLNSCYRDNERDNFFIINKDEYETYQKNYGIK